MAKRNYIGNDAKIHEILLSKFDFSDKSDEEVKELERIVDANMASLRRIHNFYNGRVSIKTSIADIAFSIAYGRRTRLKAGFCNLAEQVEDYRSQHGGLPSLPVLSKMAYETLLHDMGPEPAPRVIGDIINGSKNPDL